MRFTFSQIASLTFLFLSLGLITVSAAEEEAKANKPRIVFLGDSITAGFGLEKSEAYPGLIANIAKKNDRHWDCVNAGLSGDTTSGGVRRAKLLVRRPVDLIVVALGGNDGLRGISPATTQKNLITIIETVQKAHPKAAIILAGIDVPANMGETYKKSFLATFKTVAEKKKVIFYPNLIAGIVGDPKFNQEDMIHPNKEGQKVIAEQLFKIIQTTLSKPQQEQSNE